MGIPTVCIDSLIALNIAIVIPAVNGFSAVIQDPAAADTAEGDASAVVDINIITGSTRMIIIQYRMPGKVCPPINVNTASQSKKLCLVIGDCHIS